MLRGAEVGHRLLHIHLGVMLSVPVASTWWVLFLSGHSGATGPLARATQCGAGLRVGDNVGCRQGLCRQGQGRGGMLTPCAETTLLLLPDFFSHTRDGESQARRARGPWYQRNWGSQGMEGLGVPSAGGMEGPGLRVEGLRHSPADLGSEAPRCLWLCRQRPCDPSQSPTPIT